MKRFLVLIAIFLSVSIASAQTRQKDPFADSNDKAVLRHQIDALRVMRTRKNKLSAGELAQEQKVRLAMATKERKIDQLQRADHMAQFLKEHPNCAPGSKCSLGAK